MQAPMISVPLKATNEIDWIQPLKQYIRQTYGNDPELYSEECATLNRLRQDMRGAGKDSASGRDLLYRYYGQLELLDLRFPVDENHIKISFTWFDAFTQKPTSQYSLAYEKASIIFNISAVLSCHAAYQSRTEDSGLKVAYHSFQASAGMFTYINENFLHAPSTDLSRDTVKTLIQIMLAQGQEVFLEKQIADGKKFGLLAKLASQAGYLYSHVLEGTQENVNKAVFEKVWLLVIQIKSTYMTSLSQYYQALADDDANSHGIAISRLLVAEAAAKEATKLSNSFPGTVPASSNLASESGVIFLEITKRHLILIQEKLAKLTKDNDFIYHQVVPPEAGLAIIPKLAAAKAIPVSQLYTGQDIQRITGPDIFLKIIPISVTESASLYDEEKAKLIRAETERVESANSEMAASLDYLHLPTALHIIKGNFDKKLIADDEFKRWCQEIANRYVTPYTSDYLKSCRESINIILDKCSQQLDLEESVCEKMRLDYEESWTQQPSSRLTMTLRSDIRSYRDALEDASPNDNKLLENFARNKSDFDEMRSAGQMDEADVLFQKALIQLRGSKHAETPRKEESLLDEDIGNNAPSIMDQVARVEDILKKLNLIKRERSQVLKDLKEKVHNDDISQVLILNKKSLPNYEAELFQAELEKFRPHQSRLISATHKQTSLMKELTSTLNTLLQDRRVKAEQSKYESLSRQRSSIMSKYKKVYQDFLEYEAGVQSAKEWYRSLKETVESLGKNVETFFNNRRSEGAQLLSKIEHERKINDRASDKDNERLPNLMGQMFINSSPLSQTLACNSMPSTNYSQTNISNQHQASNKPIPSSSQLKAPYVTGSSSAQRSGRFSPEQSQSHNLFPVPQNQPSQLPGNNSLGAHTSMHVPTIQSPFLQNSQKIGGPSKFSAQPMQLPPGYIPPPPPPGPPPLLPQQTFPNIRKPMSHELDHINQSQQSSNDPWLGLNSWR